MSTGTMWSTPCTTLYVGNGPPALAQAPMAMTHLGSAIWSYSVRTMGAIFLHTVPAMIMQSLWRGEDRKMMPKRSRSLRAAPVAIISMAQHARPKLIGHSEDDRAQLNSFSSVVVITGSSGMLLTIGP